MSSQVDHIFRGHIDEVIIDKAPWENVPLCAGNVPLSLLCRQGRATSQRPVRC